MDGSAAAAGDGGVAAAMMRAAAGGGGGGEEGGAAAAAGATTGPAVGGRPGAGGGAAPTSAVDVIRRMTARLGYDPATANAARHTALRAHELAGAADVPWAGRNPATVAGAVAVAVHLLARVKATEARELAEVAAGGGGAGGGAPSSAAMMMLPPVPAEIPWSEFNAKVGMASQTLRAALADMKPWLTARGQLVPEAFATQEQLKRLGLAIDAKVKASY